MARAPTATLTAFDSYLQMIGTRTEELKAVLRTIQDRTRTAEILTMLVDDQLICMDHLSLMLAKAETHAQKNTARRNIARLLSSRVDASSFTELLLRLRREIDDNEWMARLVLRDQDRRNRRALVRVLARLRGVTKDVACRNIKATETWTHYPDQLKPQRSID